MPASMSPFDRALWNVAEAASRYSNSMADTERRQAWHDIETAMEAVRALCAKAAAPAPPPAPSLSPEQLAAAQRTAEILRQRAEEAERRLAEAEAACWQMETERDAARVAVDAARADTALLTAEIDSLKRALAVAEAGRAEAVVALDRAIMRVEERRAPAPRNEAAAVTADPAEVWAPPRTRSEVSVEHAGLLAVRATMGNLLPDSLTDHLVPGARVVRQDGRLAALIGVPAEPDGTMSPEAAEQAGRLVAQGFRVDWVSEDELVA